MSVVQALLPLKDLVAAKSRLSGLLSSSERRALAQAMVEDVLAMLSVHRSVDTVTLVSDDPAARLLADRYGLTLLPESGLGAAGLNAVLEAATGRMALEKDDHLVVLHGDIPLFDGSELETVLATLDERGGLVIGCDRHGTGTNLLAFALADKPRYAFGPGSCERHEAAAAALGVPSSKLSLPGLALDVDEPDDLELLQRRLDEKMEAAGYTRDLLVDSELGRRLALAFHPETLVDPVAREEQR